MMKRFSAPEDAGDEVVPRLPLGITLGVTVCVVSSLFSAFSDWLLQGQPRSDVHNVAFYDDLAKKVKAVSPDIPSMGYLTNASDLHMVKFQYAMTPMLLTQATTEKTVLGYFPSTAPDKVAEIAAGKGLHVLNNIGNDVYLLARLK